MDMTTTQRDLLDRGLTTNADDDQDWYVTQPDGFHGAAFVHTGAFDSQHHICVCYGHASLALERATLIAEEHNRGRRNTGVSRQS